MPTWTFADRVRKIRRDVLKVEQGRFADLLGVTRQAYAAWESGRNEPRSILAVARRIEEVSGVPAVWVLGIEGGGTSRPAAEQVMRGNIGATPGDDRAVIIPFPQSRASEWAGEDAADECGSRDLELRAPSSRLMRDDDAA